MAMFGGGCPKCWDSPCSCGYIGSKEYIKDKNIDDAKFRKRMKLSKVQRKQIKRGSTNQNRKFIKLLTREMDDIYKDILMTI